MPRNVRNFWMVCGIDGRTTEFSGGPQSKDGGFFVRIQIREDGDIRHQTVLIRGLARPDGSLQVSAFDEKGDHIILANSTR